MSDPTPLLRYCAEHSLNAVGEDGGVSIASADIGAVMELVSVFKTAIEDIEIRKGAADQSQRTQRTPLPNVLPSRRRSRSDPR